MIVPLVLLLLSLAGVAATLSDPVLADYRLLAALAVLASLILLAKGYAARRSALAEAARQRQSAEDGKRRTQTVAVGLAYSPLFQSYSE